MDISSIEYINVPPDSTLLVKIPVFATQQEAVSIRENILAMNIPNVRDVIVVPETVQISVAVVAQ